MGGYKHIEACVGEYIAKNYSCAVEIGIGRNTTAAEIVNAAGRLLLCTDVRDFPEPRKAGLPFATDDVFSPQLTHYRNPGVIYAIRPAIEVIPSLVHLAEALDCDLVVYHLGFETYGNGGEVIDCGVLLHRYRAATGRKNN